ncbi:DUF1275 family protein [Streptomyces sp. NPDC056230]|uniref:DUF1275 family protein n=1 Tax=Streptomyces sp. NPDC056230 TaxID=3345754 RepID=UPI0035E094BF
MLASAMAVQTVLFAGALGTTVAGHDKVGTTVQYTLTVLLGLAMGLQNAVARRLGVPDLTTTVLTLTLTGLAADSGPAGGAAPRSLVLAVAPALLATGAAVLWRLSVPGAGWAAAP